MMDDGILVALDGKTGQGLSEKDKANMEQIIHEQHNRRMGELFSGARRTMIESGMLERAALPEEREKNLKRTLDSLAQSHQRTLNAVTRDPQKALHDYWKRTGDRVELSPEMKQAVTEGGMDERDAVITTLKGRLEVEHARKVQALRGQIHR